MIRKKSIINLSGKRILSLSPYKNQKSERETRDIPDTELLPLSIPTSALNNQGKVHEITSKDESLLMPPNRLSLVLEIENCIEDVLAIQQAEQNPTNRATVCSSAIDSPHPIKHCQIRCNVPAVKK